MTAHGELLARAYGYPFSAPGDPADPAPAVLPEDRIAVLAFGANASRAVLARKLGAAAAAVTVLDAHVHGVDTVYSAHIAPYGAIPATLHPSPGTVLAARVLLLPADALDPLDATERNYRRAPLTGARVEVVGVGAVAAEAYHSRHGPLDLGGGPVAVAGIAAEGRVFASRTQRDIHRAVRDLLEPGAELDAFVLAGARDRAVRARRTARLHDAGRPGSVVRPGR